MSSRDIAAVPVEVRGRCSKCYKSLVSHRDYRFPSTIYIASFAINLSSVCRRAVEPSRTAMLFCPFTSGRICYAAHRFAKLNLSLSLSFSLQRHLLFRGELSRLFNYLIFVLTALRVQQVARPLKYFLLARSTTSSWRKTRVYKIKFATIIFVNQSVAVIGWRIREIVS